MILFGILLIIAIVLAIITIVAIVVGGTGMIIVFGDVIVCIFILFLIMRFIIKR